MVLYLPLWYINYHANPGKGVMMFGEFIKTKRLALDMSLREFCKKIDEDPSNWSKVERGVLSPPKTGEKLEKIAKVLKIPKESGDWEKMHDLSNISSGNIPDYIMKNEEVLQSLPAFFRTVGNVKPAKEEIQKLIDKLKAIRK